MLISKCPLCNSSGESSFQSKDFLFNNNEIYRYMQCKHCSLIYQDPIPAPDQIDSFYPDDYKVYQKARRSKHGYMKLAVLRYRYNYKHLNVSRLFRLFAPILAVFRYRDTIRFVPNGRGLDIGCGNGKFIRSMNFIGWNIEGVDFNPVAVDFCRKAGLKVFHGDLQSVAFKDNSFDLVSARHVIEHVPNPKEFVIEIARILKKRGRLVIRTPNSEALGRRWFGINWYANDVPRHLILFNPTNLNMLAKCHGLRLINGKTITSPKNILNSWNRLKKNQDNPSKKQKIRRLIARLYVVLAALTRRGDEIFAIYEKS